LYFADYEDGFKSIPFKNRGSCPFDDLAIFGLDVYDYVFAKGNDFQFKKPVVCNETFYEGCYGLSDHVPIWVEL